MIIQERISVDQDVGAVLKVIGDEPVALSEKLGGLCSGSLVFPGHVAASTDARQLAFQLTDFILEFIFFR